MLEDINNFLNTGEINNLFNSEEKENLLYDIKDMADRLRI